nr:citrate synthase, glyoxysomal [Tanacetum cinerariifolium]
MTTIDFGTSQEYYEQTSWSDSLHSILGSSIKPQSVRILKSYILGSRNRGGQKSNHAVRKLKSIWGAGNWILMLKNNSLVAVFMHLSLLAPASVVVPLGVCTYKHMEECVTPYPRTSKSNDVSVGELKSFPKRLNDGQAPTMAATTYLRMAGRPPVLPSSTFSYSEIVLMIFHDT